MRSDQFLGTLQKHANTFAKAVATNEGEWIIKGFIDVYRRIYTISVDTKIVSKVIELLLLPMFVEFADKNASSSNCHPTRISIPISRSPMKPPASALQLILKAPIGGPRRR